jgi:hypothetical protein
MPLESLDPHYRIVIKAMMEGRVVPLLGAGINLCGRPADVVWERQNPRFLPSGVELARFLAEYFEYPPGDTVRDLVRVSQYAAVMQGLGPLYDELHEIFDADYEPSAIHGFLASLPEIQRAKGFRPQFQLIVTTNYDDALERTFRAAGEEFDVVSYVADGEHRGKFLHRPPEGEPRLIETPNEYAELALDVRTVILKIHGAVDRVDSEWGDSYVITEDHYIDYLTRTDISGLLPVTLSAKLRRSHFLFLGYAMRDWNLRVILHRIWGQQKLNYKSWAIQVEPEPVEREFWQKRGVDILDVPLERYVEGLVAGLREPLGAGVGT